MTKVLRDTRSYRGVLQSDDGRILKVVSRHNNSITFESAFGLSSHMIDRLKSRPEHIVFSERSRIARLGVQITCEPPSVERLDGDLLILQQTASAVIPGYPDLDQLRAFFDEGLPVGRLVFCDPDALLSSEQVMAAIERSDLKLPASTAISSDGSIVIAPHRVVCTLRQDIINEEIFGRILLREDGREMLNRYQIPTSVPHLIIPPGEGVITTCSMYLNEHYVVLQSGFSLGRNLPATVLDPIKTRGIRIYLEIINGTGHTIVNPLISARVYGAPKEKTAERRRPSVRNHLIYSQDELMALRQRLDDNRKRNCHFIDRSLALIDRSRSIQNATIYVNGPQAPCMLSAAQCSAAREDFSPKSKCPHEYATARISVVDGREPAVLALKYFPNLIEHRDIVNLVADNIIDAIYFYEASCEHGPFLSQEDHSRLQEYHAFGVDVYWVCNLNDRLMVHTMRDGKGYFVAVDRLADFHKSMLFAFYGSALPLSEGGVKRLGRLMDALVSFWGRNIGIVTGGGSGVMESANTLARRRGILSGANFLDITDQAMTTDVDFCQVFQATCRHSRQKWFEIASFPIFNVGGLGSLEELGITLCNMKLSIMERVPIILFDSEGEKGFWEGMRRQISDMVRYHRAPAWIEEHILITDDPEEVIDAYRRKLQLF